MSSKANVGAYGTAVVNAPAEATASGVAWSAIIGGAFAAAAVSLILLILGSALGLSAISPWSHSDHGTALTIGTAIWLVVMQWISSGLGGYLTGRLRTKWVGMHTDEVFFRDTAHGFLTWAVSTILTASVLTSAIASVVSGGLHATTMMASGAAMGASQAAANSPSSISDPTGYYIDSLFRSDTPNPSASSQDARAEAVRILATGIKNGAIPDNDKTYLASMVSARTGLSPAEASRRVDEVIAQVDAAKEKAKQMADEARKAAMHGSLYIFLSLLIGAFIASASAALGGKQRDGY
jgi:hypothetical protein